MILLFLTILQISFAQTTNDSTLVQTVDGINSIVKQTEAPKKTCETPQVVVNPCDEKSNIKLFKKEEPIKMTFKAAFPVKGKKISGTISYVHDEKEIVLNADFEPKKGIRSGMCGFPPFKVRLTSNTKGTVFNHSHDGLKYVTHCDKEYENMNDEQMRENVIKEYTLYKILNASGLPSLKVRLTETEYISEDGSKKTMPGFFIEDKEDMAQRCGGHSIKKFDNESFSAYDTHKVLAAEHLVGNIDYSSNHNVVLIKTEADMIHVPYDLDLSHLVRFQGSQNLTETMLQQISAYKDSPEWPSMLAQYKTIAAHKMDILETIKASTLSDETKKNWLKSYEGLFTEIEKLN